MPNNLNLVYSGLYVLLYNTVTNQIHHQNQFYIWYRGFMKTIENGPQYFPICLSFLNDAKEAWDAMWG